ncbi:hypothetical protein AAC387_Pa03g3744 [Persea americana]
MGAQISTNLSSGCSSRELRYLNIKSKADLCRFIKCANKSTLMVINFTTTWCQPCKDAEPPMRKLAEEFPDVKFARVDIDLLQDVVKEFHLETMPTFLLCKKGDDGPDKGKGAAEVGGGNGSGNRIAGDTKAKNIPKAKQDNGLASVTDVKSATNVKESSANGVKEGNSVTASATQEKSATSVKEGNSAISSVTQGKSVTSTKEGKNVVPSAIEGKSANNVKEANSVISSAIEDKRTTSIKGGNSVVPNATEGESADSVEEANSVVPSAIEGKRTTSMKEDKSADSVEEGNSVVPSAIEGKRTTSMKEGNSVVPSATQGKPTTSIKEGSNVVSSASEGKSATSVEEGNRAAAGATGGKSGTGVERVNSAAVSGSKGKSATANAKEGQRIAPAPKAKNATSTVKEGNSLSTKINSMKNGDGVTGVKEKEGDRVPSPKKRTVNYAGKVIIDEIDRMEGPLERQELTKKIEYYKEKFSIVD